MAIGMSLRLFLVAWHTALWHNKFVRVVLKRIRMQPSTLPHEGAIAAFVNSTKFIGRNLVGDHQVRLEENRIVNMDDFLP